MATIVITVRTGNAQMSTWADVRDAVTTTVERMADRAGEEYAPAERDSAPAFDINGNRVGGLVVIEDR